MRERIKTIALFSLVILSLVLTYRLWFGSPDYEAITPPTYERLSFGEPLSLESLLLPEKIVYMPPARKIPEEDSLPEESQEHFPEEEGNELAEEQELEEETEEPQNKYYFHYTDSLYSDLWDAFSCELMTATSLNCTLTDFKKLSEGMDSSVPSLEIHFSVPFSLDLYFSNQNNNPSFPLVEKLLLTLEVEGGMDYFKTPQGEIYRLDWDFNCSPLTALEDQILDLSEHRYYLLEEIIKEEEEINEYLTAEKIRVPKTSTSLPDLNYKKENLDIDNLVKVFFVDFTLVRQIKQRDDAVMYTDGQKGLRLDSQGFIEYSAPAKIREGKELSYQESLEKGIDFVTIYGGWPQDLNLRIEDLNTLALEQEEYYQLKFNSYYRGVPLGLDQWVVELTYNEQGLVGYQRQVYEVEDTGEDLRVMEIKEVLSQLVSRKSDLFSPKATREITDCFLAYIPLQDSGENVMTLCWIVEVDGWQVFKINARNGRIITNTP